MKTIPICIDSQKCWNNCNVLLLIKVIQLSLDRYKNIKILSLLEGSCSFLRQNRFSFYQKSFIIFRTDLQPFYLCLWRFFRLYFCFFQPIVVLFSPLQQAIYLFDGSLFLVHLSHLPDYVWL